MNLRFAPDWRAAEFAPLGAPADAVLFPTGSRPLRVGVMVSYESTITRGWHNFFGSMSGQVQSTPLFPATGLQMVGVVEPGTVHRGIVERTLRDYSLIGGLVEADDVLGLATLDVLLIGNNFALSPNIISAINRAVRGGVGLLNEYWTRAHQGIVKDRCLQELMLADSQYYSYHTSPTCGVLSPGRVINEHPLLPGLRAGTRVKFGGCGPAYRISPTAKVLIAQERRIPASEHGMRELGALQLPSYVVGQLGRGRIVVVHAWPHERILSQLSIARDEYFRRLLDWLAEPKRA
jgi:hypothetical protein